MHISYIIAIIIGILYFASPIDLIPSSLVEDDLVLGLIIRQVSSNLDKYKEWLEETQMQE